VSSHAPNQARVIPLRPAAERREPLWRDIVGDVLRRERLAQERTLKDVADEARISVPYLSEVERGRKEASSEVVAAAAHALGLGMMDLLTLAQEELVRIKAVGQGDRRHNTRTPSVTSVTSVASVMPDVARRDLNSGRGPRQFEARLAA
jgi:transcriptional regulator with XRE-family HTH domain